ncbi:response regulator transcription factor [Burkholderia cenocepacia]|uniref:response regulator transcription factor n=1 Tax=Burkholderia cenocepacia TaxID=95486 RepID=UPI0002343817|nr:response regulator transcription factor [Burkholderia cenocepacia]MDI9647356.1 response regulator transcription factor [Burkholderia cenocepacia]MDN7821805.1 response regulator transcription factor [Burkholderia cenocepacia]MDR8101826.1 response regulator transcription factor [Burkholderia cenocepacia]CDN63396.1 putative Response regulator [Burkholderia cenocepacia H111]HEM9001276.1 response regulator transcription factor [Burkholderia cenocepacia]
MDEFSMRVIVADDHPVTANGIAQALAGAPTIEVAGVASSTTKMVEQLDASLCDVLLLDYVMPAEQYGDGQALLAFLRRRYPSLRFVTVTMLNSPVVFHAVQKLGVKCIVSKSDAMSHLIAAVHAAYSNGAYLSPTVSAALSGYENRTAAELSLRESEIVRLFREGYKVTEIAEKLHRSKKTISAQKLSAMRKLGVTRDADLIRFDGVAESARPPDSAGE